VYLIDNCIPEMSYYNMTMDDIEECVVHDCYAVMEFDENDAIDYNNDDHDNNDNNISQLNIVENSDNINENTLQIMFNEYNEQNCLQGNE